MPMKTLMNLNAMGRNLQSMYGSAGLNSSGKSGKSQSMTSAKGSADVRNMKRLISNARRDGEDAMAKNRGLVSCSILDSMERYKESIRDQRMKAGDTKLQMKKLKYQYKNISSKILQSKTSNAARQVEGQARREVLRLKRQKMNKDVDQEELEAAITHAKEMERIAKKKVRHLEEEEMAKVSGGGCFDQVESKEEQEKGIKEAEDLERQKDSYEKDSASLNQAAGEMDVQDIWENASLDDYFRENIDFSELEQYADLSMQLDSMDDIFSDMRELTSEVLDSVSDTMKELLEELGLDELSDSLLAEKGDVDPADLKMMKIKHRCKEMKEIVKADAEYLKVIFDKLSKEKLSGVSGMGANHSAGAVNFGSAFGGAGSVTLSDATPHIDVAVSGDFAEGAASAAIDVAL